MKNLQYNPQQAFLKDIENKTFSFVFPNPQHIHIYYYNTYIL
jgi:hypothetical protein